MQRKFDKNWQIPLHDVGKIEQMARTLAVPAPLAQLLCARNIPLTQARQFLDNPFGSITPPSELFGCEKAANLILEGINNNDSFVVYGDYDLDGMSAAAVLYRIITALGGKVNYYIPDRLDDGYGLHTHTVERLSQQGYNWLITVDCGVHSLEEIALANALGMKTIVTDHHPVRESGELPPALAVVHPAIPYNGKSAPELSGSAVAFKLAWQLCCAKMQSPNVGPRLRRILLELLGIATLGIVADVVPLTGDNRILTANGLKYLRDFAPIGIMALLRSQQLHEQPIKADNIAFKIAPLLNAAGRVGDPNKAVELLLTSQPQQAQSLVSLMAEWNFKRKSLEQAIDKQAQEQVEQNYADADTNPVLVLAQSGWHEGVIGVVANRIVEKYNRPTVMISIPDENSPDVSCAGSSRSVEGFDIKTALAHCDDLLLRSGGHKMAAGLAVERKNIDAFREKINLYARNNRVYSNVEKPIYVDAEIPLAALTMDTVRAMEALAPFGRDNPLPTFMATNVALASAPRITVNGNSVQFDFYQSGYPLSGVAFHHSDWASEFINSDCQNFDIVFHASLNHFAGRVSVQIQLIDWRTHEN